MAAQAWSQHRGRLSSLNSSLNLPATSYQERQTSSGTEDGTFYGGNARRLLTPRTGNRSNTVAEWLAKKAGCDKTPKLARLAPVAHLSPVSPAAPVRSSEELDVESCSGSSSSRPISRDLQRRRQQHPRLRWPKLSRDVSAPSSRGFSANASTCDLFSIGDENLLDFGAISLSEDDEGSSGTGQSTGPIVIDQHSMFYAEQNPVAWPPWPSGGFNSKLKLPTNISELFADLQDDDGDDRACPSLLMPTKPVLPPAPGSTATEQSDVVDLADRKHTQDTALGARRLAVKSGNVSQGKNKWTRRQPPVSCVMALSASGACGASKRKVQGIGVQSLKSGQADEDDKYLSFWNWGLDDSYLRTLLNAVSETQLARLRHMNLSNNRLKSESISILAAVGRSLGGLLTFNVSSNLLGEAGGRAFAGFLINASPRLEDFNINENNIGDKACEELCEALRFTCRGLQRLSMGRNKIGGVARGGEALGSLIEYLKELEILDLHWNSIHGSSAAAILQGIYDNSCTVSGKLRRVDLSWNQIGSRCNQRRQQNHQACRSLDSRGQTCACSTCVAATRAIKALASTFEDGSMLFHLDISYNGLSFGDCSVLADGLRDNHTLFGLHIVGNEATMDDRGFIVPRSDASSHSEKIQLQLNHHSRSSQAVQRVVDMALANDIADDRSQSRVPAMPLQAPLLEGGSAESEVQRNVDCCWICEKWVHQEVSYIPSWSGPEASMEEINAIENVFVFFSLDRYSQPTILTKVEENFSRKLFQSSKSPRQSCIPSSTRATRKSKTSCVVRTDAGKVIRWVGFRMLPPSREPIHVIYQVNSKFVVAEDKPAVELRAPKLLQLAGYTGRDAAMEQVSTANYLNVSQTAMERFEKGDVVALVVFEDPEHRGAAAVKPRVVGSAQPHPKTFQKEWTFETSSFSEFKRDTDAVVAKCFDFDWRMSKLPSFVKSSSQEFVKEFMRPIYAQIIATYYSFAFEDKAMRSSKGVCILSLSGFSSIISMYAENTRLFNKHFSHADIDTCFVASNVISLPKDKRRAIVACSDKGLSRFQFLEALVRVAVNRFVRSGEVEEPVQACQEFLRITKIGEHILEMRAWLHAGLFNEECCMVYKENAATIKKVYETYRQLHPYPGAKVSRGMSFLAWLQLMEDLHIVNESTGYDHRSFCKSFALGRRLHVDDVNTFEAMELQHSEFLVALGALVSLQRDFEIEMFADHLLEFFQDEFLHAVQIATGGSGDIGHIAKDSMFDPVLKLVARIFEQADDDHSGTLSSQEFMRCFSKPYVHDEIQHLGLDISISDVRVLFFQMDADNSGQVSLSELMQGFVRMKMEMKAQARIVSHLRGIFAEMDTDGSGSLNLKEFDTMMHDLEVQRKFESLNISIDDCDELWQETTLHGQAQEVTPDHFVAAFLRIRDPKMAGNRGVSFLWKAFNEADSDRSGYLSKGEVEIAFCNSAVTEKLHKLHLEVPFWLDIFDSMDTDGNGELSWEELRQGMVAFWERSIERKLNTG